jgi:c-di-GMP-binding flagellar brake protein YcgR
MAIETNRKPAVHDQVLVETQIDGKVVGFRAVVVNVQPSSLWLGLIRPDSLLEQVQAGQILHLTFRRENAALAAESTFMNHLGSNRSRLFAVERPASAHMIQRRAHVRLDYECPVVFTCKSETGSGAAGRNGRGITRNVSAGGIQFRAPGAAETEFAVGDALGLEVPVNASETVAAEAQVVRVESADNLPCEERTRSKPGRDAAQALVAARFVTISDVDQDKIVRLIFNVQRQRRETARLLV